MVERNLRAHLNLVLQTQQNFTERHHLAPPKPWRFRSTYKSCSGDLSLAYDRYAKCTLQLRGLPLRVPQVCCSHWQAMCQYGCSTHLSLHKHSHVACCANPLSSAAHSLQLVYTSDRMLLKCMPRLSFPHWCSVTQDGDKRWSYLGLMISR